MVEDLGLFIGPLGTPMELVLAFLDVRFTSIIGLVGPAFEFTPVGFQKRVYQYSSVKEIPIYMVHIGYCKSNTVSSC